MTDYKIKNKSDQKISDKYSDKKLLGDRSEDNFDIHNINVDIIDNEVYEEKNNE